MLHYNIITATKIWMDYYINSVRAVLMITENYDKVISFDEKIVI